MSDVCLTLLCPPAVEEKLIDLLLMSSDQIAFTSAPAAAYRVGANDLSELEQVQGRAFATAIQLICTDSDKAALLQNIRAQFAGTGVRYWVTPVIEAGEIA